MRAVDLGIDVTTDPAAVASFLSKASTSVKVVMTTYQSGRVVSEGAGKAGIAFDLGVFDEAHKTVGSEGGLFAHLLSDTNIPIARRVFMTATERQYRGNSDDILSMDDASVYGETFDQLTFKAALELEPPILSDYRIVSIVVTKAEIERLIAEQAFVRSDGKEWSLEGDASTFASLVAFRKAIEKYGISHTVSFHRSIRRAKEFCELNVEASKADSTLGSLHSFHVSGDVNTAKRARILDRFVSAKPSLITNARCLTEGVDVPAIDAVLFADPRQSKIDIVQAAGRAMRRFEGKKLGYIIVPVIIDEDSDEPSDDAFDQIITVVSALAMEDERIIEEFKSIASGRRSVGRTMVEIDVPEYVRIEFGDLLANIETRIWDRLGFGWEKGFERLKSYVAKVGDAKVPQLYVDDTGFRLGTWVQNRRAFYRRGELSKVKITALEALPGWKWEVVADLFSDAFAKLEVFVAERGHARVEQSYVDESGFKLGRWVIERRSDYRKGRLTPEKVVALESLSGWTWKVRESDFEAGLESLDRFVATEGTAYVRKDFVDDTGFRLGQWVQTQRTRYRKGTLPPTSVSDFERLPGWTWDTVEDRFEQNLSRLEAFVAKHGSTSVPKDFVDEGGIQLGNWVQSQRQSYKRGELSHERIATLEALPGWVWEPYDAKFRKGIEQLAEYVRKNGDSRVPASYVDETGFRLGGWVRERRAEYKDGKSPSERIAALEAVPGWVWNQLEAEFDEYIERLKKFAAVHGHTRVPAKYVDETGYPLGKWVIHRRAAYKKGKLPANRVAELEALPGWMWDQSEINFFAFLKCLSRFAEKEGHTKVPIDQMDESGFQLGHWVRKYRDSYRNAKLGADRIAALEAIPNWASDTIEEGFDAGIESLKNFAERNGQTMVPLHHIDETGLPLGKWVKNLRNTCQKTTLPPHCVISLEALPGWVWDKDEESFQVGYERLKRYAEREGHAKVVDKSTDDAGFPLGNWVSQRRSEFKSGTLSKSRIAELEAIPGWVWAPHDAKFETGMERLTAYVKKNGNAGVSQSYVDDTGFPLGGWVGTRRLDYKKGKLSTDRIMALEALPEWKWDAVEDLFLQGLLRLQEFVGNEGHARVPSSFVDQTGFQLGRLVNRRRSQYARGKLSPDRFASLEKLPGWVWNTIDDGFQVGLKRLKKFAEREGHTKVPAKYVDETGFKLGLWVVGRRQSYKFGELSEDRIAILEALPGWMWIIHGSKRDSEEEPK